MTLLTPTDSRYYIKPRAVSFVENDLGDVNRVYVSIASGTTIMVYVPEDNLIPYDDDKEYQKWVLTGYSTKLATSDAYYIYARLSRSDNRAIILFSTKKYKVDGSVEGEEGGGNASGNYYYIPVGNVTATDGATLRTLSFDSGKLSTPDNSYTKEQADAQFMSFEVADKRYLNALDDDEASGLIRFLKGLYLGESGNPISSVITAENAEDSTLYTENALLSAAAFSKLFSIAKDDKGNSYIRTPYPLASDSTVSSLGVGEDEGGIGGATALYQLVDVLRDGDKVSGAEDGNVLMYDDATGKWYGKKVNLPDVDFSELEGQLVEVNSLIKALQANDTEHSNAIAALQAADVQHEKDIATNAASIATLQTDLKSTSDALSDLQGEHNALAGTVNDFLTGVDVDDTINRWKELENFLAGYTETATLADLLGVKADKSVVDTLTTTVNSNYTALDKLITAEKNRAVAAEGALSGRITTNATNIETNRGNIAKNTKDIAGIFATLADWFTLEDGVLHSKYGLASDSTVSSLGVGSDGTGSLSYDRLDSWDSYTDDKAGYILSAALGWDLKTRLDNLDLGDFDLSGYLSKSEAENTYATIRSLDSVISRVGNIESTYVISSDLGDFAYKNSLSASDIPNIPWSKITSGKPTSLSGYGITDAYTKEEVNNAIGEVDKRIDTLVGSSVSKAIDTFNEVVAFLKDIEDTETLEGILAGKQDAITDLATIRANAALGATALQSSDLDGYVNEIATSGSGNAITSVTKSGKKLTFNKASSFFLAGNFTKANIKSTLGISDWALASSKPSYKTSEVTEEGNLYFTTDRVKNCLTGAISTVLTTNLTASRALISNASGKIAVSAVTSTELSYLDGVTSAIQTQLNALSSRIKAYEDILKIEENNTLLHATVAFASDSTVSSLGVGSDDEGNIGGVIDLTNVVTNIVPSMDGLNIGSASSRWSKLYVTRIENSQDDLYLDSGGYIRMLTDVVFGNNDNFSISPTGTAYLGNIYSNGNIVATIGDIDSKLSRYALKSEVYSGVISGETENGYYKIRLSYGNGVGTNALIPSYSALGFTNIEQAEGYYLADQFLINDILDYVDNAVKNVNVNVDLSNYYTKTQVHTYVSQELNTFSEENLGTALQNYFPLSGNKTITGKVAISSAGFLEVQGNVYVGGKLYSGLSNNNPYATQDWVESQGYTSNIGTVTGVRINGSTKNPSSGIVDLGYVASYEDIANVVEDYLVTDYSLSSDTTDAVKLTTLSGRSQSITTATLKNSLGLKALAYKDSIDLSAYAKTSQLENYYTKDAADSAFAKVEEIETLVADEIGLYLPNNFSVASNTTNVVSVTIGSNTENISAATLKTSLGLGGAAYKAVGAVASGNTGLVTGGSVYTAIKNVSDIVTTINDNYASVDYVDSEIETLEGDLAAFITATEVDTKLQSYATKATTLAGYGITDAYTKTAADERYLNLSGGTINSTSQVPLLLNSSHDGGTTRIAFINKNTPWGYLGFNGLNSPCFISAEGAKYPLIHSGNIGNYALPLTGGEIKGSLGVTGSITAQGVGTFVNGLKVGGNNVIHSGNIGSQSVNYATSAGDASTLGGYSLSSVTLGSLYKGYMAFSASVAADQCWYVKAVYATAWRNEFNKFEVAADYGNASGKLSIELGGYSQATGSFIAKASLYNNNNVRGFKVVHEQVDGEWREVLYLKLVGGSGATVRIYSTMPTMSAKSGVVSEADVAHVSFTDVTYNNIYTNYKINGEITNANKLSTARTIWGQSFDGSGDVSGSIRNCDFVRSTDTSTDGYYIGLASQGAAPYEGLLLYTYGNTPLTMYTGRTERLRILSNGNVLIGTTTDSGDKLQVNGSASVSSLKAGQINLHINDEINRFGGNLYLQHRGNGSEGYGTTGNIICCANGGNVLIGSRTDGGYKLDVNGTSRLNGDLTVTANQYKQAVSGCVGIAMYAGLSATEARIDVVGTDGAWAANALGLSVNGDVKIYHNATVNGTLNVANVIEANKGINIYGALTGYVSGTDSDTWSITGQGAASFASLKVGGNDVATKATTLAGYGITDALSKSNPSVTGTLTVAGNVLPSNNNDTYALGSTNYRWSKLYVNGVDCTGSISSTTNISAQGNVTAINGGLSGKTLSVSGAASVGSLTVGGAVHSNLNIGGYRIKTEGGDIYGVYDGLDKLMYFDASAAFCSAFVQTSDERLKNILNGDFRLSLGTMACAPLIIFDWNNRSNRKHNVGTIAQYWQGALPEVVSKTQNGTLALAYGELGVAMGISLANILEDTNGRVATVEEEIKTLKEENKRLKERVAELEAA